MMTDVVEKETRKTSSLPDVQNSQDTRAIAINKVGIKDIRHPIQVKDRTGHVQHTIANFNMYVDLPHEFKGTHMSEPVDASRTQPKLKQTNGTWDMTSMSKQQVLTELSRPSNTCTQNVHRPASAPLTFEVCHSNVSPEKPGVFVGTAGEPSFSALTMLKVYGPGAPSGSV